MEQKNSESTIINLSVIHWEHFNDPKSFDLDEVQVTAKKPNSALGAIGIGLALRTGGLWGAEGLDPEPVTKTIGAVVIIAYSAYVIGEEAIDYYNKKKKTEEWEGLLSGGAEHTKGARGTTKAKHQNGQANEKKARGGEKRESLPPRKHPKGWTGSWPSKNNLKYERR